MCPGTRLAFGPWLASFAAPVGIGEGGSFASGVCDVLRSGLTDDCRESKAN